MKLEKNHIYLARHVAFREGQKVYEPVNNVCPEEGLGKLRVALHTAFRQGRKVAAIPSGECAPDGKLLAGDIYLGKHTTFRQGQKVYAVPCIQCITGPGYYSGYAPGIGICPQCCPVPVPSTLFYSYYIENFGDLCPIFLGPGYPAVPTVLNGTLSYLGRCAYVNGVAGVPGFDHYTGWVPWDHAATNYFSWLPPAAREIYFNGLSSYHMWITGNGSYQSAEDGGYFLGTQGVLRCIKSYYAPGRYICYWMFNLYTIMFPPFSVPPPPWIIRYWFISQIGTPTGMVFYQWPTDHNNPEKYFWLDPTEMPFLGSGPLLFSDTSGTVIDLTNYDDTHGHQINSRLFFGCDPYYLQLRYDSHCANDVMPSDPSDWIPNGLTDCHGNYPDFPDFSTYSHSYKNLIITE